MASCNLINRVYYGMAVGAGIEEIRSNLLSEGEKEYDIWLAYKAAEVIFEQDVAIEEGIPLSVSQKITSSHFRCPDCDGDLGGNEIGRLENHSKWCPRFPL
jgi:hypothetical protein